MLNCPHCQRELERADSGSGWAWSCPTCHGRALTLAQLRKGIEPQFINDLWQQSRHLREAGKKGSCACPSCQQRMTVVQLGQEEKHLVMDVCPTCHLVWFDDQETARLPIRSAKPPTSAEIPLTPEAREAIALAKVQLISERAERESAYENTHTPGDLWIKMLWEFFWRS